MNPNTQIAYKVLRQRNNLLSANVHFYQRYFKNKINFPKIKGSKLFACETLENARRLIENEMISKAVIFKVEITNPTEINAIPRPTIKDLEGEWSSFKEWDKRSGYENYRSAPYGTILCDSIKILEKVKNR